MRFPPLLALLLLVLVAPTPLNAQPSGKDRPDLTAFRILAERDAQLLRVGFRLATRNAPFCRETENVLGVSLHNLRQYGNRDLARAAFGFEGEFAVLAVAPDSPAQRAGIRADDVLLAIDGERLIPDEAELAQSDENAGYAAFAWGLGKLEAALADPPLTLSLLQGGEAVRHELVPVAACQTRFEVDPSPDVKASADGRLVSVASAMVEFAGSDDELAALVAHELAHNILKHRERLNAAGIDRGILQQFGRNARLTKQTEVEADRLSVWLMANAGYDPEAAIRFWTRFGKEHGKGILSAPTHYRWRNRVKFIGEELQAMKTAERGPDGYLPPLMAAPPPPLE